MIINQLDHVTPVGEVIETSVCTVWMGSDGIVRNVFHLKVEVTLPDAIETNKANLEVGGGNKIVCLIDARNVKSSNREAREFGARPETVDQRTAAAILIGSPVSRAIGTLFMKLSRPPYPSRLFTSETEAVDWLKEFL